MAVTRRDLNRRPVAIPVADRDWAAPLDRQFVNRSRVPARAMFGLILIAYSSIATVMVIDALAAPSFGDRVLFGLDAGIAAGMLLAAILTFGQWVSNGYNWLAYLVFLAPDVWITFTFTLPFIEPLTPNWAWLVSLAWAVVCARFGEVLLLGRVR